MAGNAQREYHWSSVEASRIDEETPRLGVLLSSAGRFHVFDLARELEYLGCLEQLYTSYLPSWVDELPREKVKSYPWVTPWHLLVNRFNLKALGRILNWRKLEAHDHWVACNLVDADLFVALSSCGLHSFRAAKARGMKTICDRGSTHIGYQSDLLLEEYERHGLRWTPTDLRIVAKELEEYAIADLITVPSRFARRSFAERGVSETKVAVLPYGVDLSMFSPQPKTDDVFRVLFVGALSLRKGIPDLLEAVAELDLPRFELTLVGPVQAEVQPWLQRFEGRFRYPGVVLRRKLAAVYSQASVFVLPSIEEGLALVQAQAMACGVPVIATYNTGAEDLFTHGVEGFILPSRSPEAIREKVLYLYHHPDIREAMGRAALQRVRSLGGWRTYGRQAAQVYQMLVHGSDIRDNGLFTAGI